MRAGQNGKNGISRLFKNGHNGYAGGIEVSKAESDINNKRKAERGMAKNSQERINIHKHIDELIKDGKGKSEIIAFLLEKYPSSSVKQFFDNYVNDHFKKRGINQPSADKDNGERYG